MYKTKLRIAIVRGDFVSPWELQNFYPLSVSNEVTLFTGKYPVTKVDMPTEISRERLWSPVDLNFGVISRSRMAILNRLFIDAHYLYGLEDRLKGFDIAHCAETYFHYNMQCLNAKKMGYVKKVVSTVWENIPFNNEGILGRKDFKRRSFTEIDLFIAVTETSKRALIQEGCHPSKIVIMSPGVNLKNFISINLDKFMGIKKNKNLKVLSVIRLVEEKGALILLDTYKRFKNRRNIEFVLIGQGPLEEQVIEIIARENLKNVHYLGSVNYSDMPKIYSLCDVLLHPAIGSDSWQEQYGMVLVEAMASGLVILTVPSGSIRDVVGNAGFLSSPVQLVPKLQALLLDNELRSKFSSMSIDRAKSFSADKYSKDLQAKYSEILSRSF